MLYRGTLDFFSDSVYTVVKDYTVIFLLFSLQFRDKLLKSVWFKAREKHREGYKLTYRTNRTSRFHELPN